MEGNMAGAAGMGIGVLVVGTIVSIIVGALVLMLATKMVEKFTPSFGKAILAAVVGLIASWIVRWILGFVLSGGPLSILISAVIGLLVTAWVIMKMIPRPSGGAMPYGRACLIALMEWVILFVLVAIIGLLFGGVMVAAMHAG